MRIVCCSSHSASTVGQRSDGLEIEGRPACRKVPGARANEFLIVRCSATRTLILMSLEDITLKRAAKGRRAKSVSNNR